MKSKQTKALKLPKKFEDCQEEWGSDEGEEGVDPKFCQHTIPMQEYAKPSIQCPYSYNENFVKKIDEEIDQLKEASSFLRLNICHGCHHLW